MKTLSRWSRALMLWVATASVFHLSAVALLAQATVQFNNTPATLMTTNSTQFPPPGQQPNQTGVTTGLGHYTIGLYIAPQGTTNPNAFILMGPTALSQSGIGNGRFDMNPLPNFFVISNNSGQTIAFQVRAWSTFAGATYEAARTNGNPGRYLGVSGIGEVTPATGLVTAPPLFSTFVGGTVGGLVLTPAVPFGLSITDIVVAEPPQGSNATFTVSLPYPSTQTVTVAYATASGTALANVDYSPTNGTLTFSPGQTNKQITVSILEDGIPEPDETFTVILSNAVNAGIIRGTGTCSIFAEIRMTSLGFHVDVAFTTLNGARYRVERSDNVTTWLPVAGATNVLGTGNTVSITDSNASCLPMRVYRAVRFQ